MKMSRWIALPLLLALVLASTAASAFDGNRKGFVLGFGAGLGGTSFTQELSGGPLTLTGDRESGGAWATTFKIGVGLTERTLLLYQQNQNWLGTANLGSGDVTVASGSGVIAVNHYVSDASPIYLVGGLGVGTWGAPFDNDINTSVGGSFLLGTGINFRPHWSVEFNFSFANPNDSDAGIKLETKATNFSVTVMGLAF